MREPSRVGQAAPGGRRSHDSGGGRRNGAERRSLFGPWDDPSAWD